MNARIAFLVILAAALNSAASVSLSAAPKENPPAGYSVSRIEHPHSWSAEITRGTSQWTVSSALGQPFEKVSPDIWVYHDFQANLSVPDDQGCNLLVITFAQGKVANMKLVNRTAEKLIAAHSTFKQAGQYASAQ